MWEKTSKKVYQLILFMECCGQKSTTIDHEALETIKGLSKLIYVLKRCLF